jgi:hypothetical protein
VTRVRAATDRPSLASLSPGALSARSAPDGKMAPHRSQSKQRRHRAQARSSAGLVGEGERGYRLKYFSSSTRAAYPRYLRLDIDRTAT